MYGQSSFSSIPNMFIVSWHVYVCMYVCVCVCIVFEIHALRGKIML